MRHREHQVGALAVLELEQLGDRRSGPLRCHSSAGCSTGISISWPPIAFISSRMICTTFWCTRQPAGSHVHRPAPSWRIRPGADHQLVRERLGVGGRPASRSAGSSWRGGSCGGESLVDQNARCRSLGRPDRGDSAWPTKSRRSPTTTTRSSRTSTRRRCEFHHDKHHQAYVDKANAALEGTRLDGKPIEEVLAEPRARCPTTSRGAVRNNGGGHYNHSLFWESMSPDGGGEPDGDLADGDRRARSAPSTTSRRSSRRPASTSSAPAGRGSSTTAAASRSSARRTRTTRSPTARRRCSASTSGSTPTT